MRFRSKKLLYLSLLAFPILSSGQVLSLKKAVEIGTENYGIIKAKKAFAESSTLSVGQSRLMAIPDFTIAAQNDYGTINGQNGPLFGFGGQAATSSGPVLDSQNWNAAFGALYLANVNWDVYAFGRARQRINLAKAQSQKATFDFEQEKFQQSIKIAAAYLNLLAAERVEISQLKNLERAEIFHRLASVRVKNGLLAGVDSTVAFAEVSRARIMLNQIKENKNKQQNQLQALMGMESNEIIVDTAFVSTIPKFPLTSETLSNAPHPQEAFMQSRVNLAEAETRLFKTERFPTLSLFGIYQGRASGFGDNYGNNQTSFTQNYLDGINPSRENYLLGIGLKWNLSDFFRNDKKASAQKMIAQGVAEELKQVKLELVTQAKTADATMQFALQNYAEAPRQVEAAAQAYLQKSTLYKNGLTTLTEVTQALYALNRAETDRDIIYTNVWQALLMKAAATGDMNLFMNEF
ncbi:TolC family protein [Flavobacterium ardleyense]|uniref:TolC family protein n=1 Tax=Flavobacterium ardleyense TaxID=2038737 RepID=UPI00298C15A7|nr:TolC family protein [Flavobacterium ardleyense]